MNKFTRNQMDIILDGVRSGASPLDLATILALMECENVFDAIESSIGRSARGAIGGITRVKKE